MFQLAERKATRAFFYKHPPGAHGMITAYILVLLRIPISASSTQGFQFLPLCCSCKLRTNTNRQRPVRLATRRRYDRSSLSSEPKTSVFVQNHTSPHLRIQSVFYLVSVLTNKSQFSLDNNFKQTCPSCRKVLLDRVSQIFRQGGRVYLVLKIRIPITS